MPVIAFLKSGRSPRWRTGLLLVPALALLLAACGGGGREGTPIAIGNGSTDTGVSSTSSSSSSISGTAVTASGERLILKIPYEISTRLHLVPALPTTTGDSAPLQLRNVAQFCAAGGSYASTSNGSPMTPGASFASASGTFQTVLSACQTGTQRIDGAVLNVAVESQGQLLSRLTLTDYQTVFQGLTHTLSGSYLYTRDTAVSGVSLTVTPVAGATLSGSPFGSGVTFVSGQLLEADEGIEFDQLRYRHLGVEYVASGTWVRASLTQPLTGLVSVSEAVSGTVRGYLRMQNGVLNVEAP